MTVDQEGWLISSGKRIMWLSPAMHGILRRPGSGCSLVISRGGCLGLNLRGVALGEQWKECYFS